MIMENAAKLTGLLLARKGTAVPTGFAPPRLVEPAVGNVVSVARPATLVQPAPEVNRPSAESNAEAHPTRMRVSMRIETQQHLRMRLTAAYLQRSVQSLMAEALDRYLDQLAPEVMQDQCVCLAMKCGQVTD